MPPGGEGSSREPLSGVEHYIKFTGTRLTTKRGLDQAQEVSVAPAAARHGARRPLLAARPVPGAPAPAGLWCLYNPEFLTCVPGAVERVGQPVSVVDWTASGLWLFGHRCGSTATAEDSTCQIRKRVLTCISVRGQTPPSHNPG